MGGRTSGVGRSMPVGRRRRQLGARVSGGSAPGNNRAEARAEAGKAPQGLRASEGKTGLNGADEGRSSAAVTGVKEDREEGGAPLAAALHSNGVTEGAQQSSS